MELTIHERSGIFLKFPSHLVKMKLFSGNIAYNKYRRIRGKSFLSELSVNSENYLFERIHGQ